MRELTILSDLHEVEKIRRFLRENLEGWKVPAEPALLIELSTLEMCLNIINYAYPESKGEIRLKMWRQEETIYLEIRDDGTAFDPRTIAEPDIEEILKGGQRKGFGIHLSRKLMDGFDYLRENNQNVLLMHKKVPPTQAKTGG